MPGLNRQKQVSAEKVSKWLTIGLSALSSLSAFLISLWSFLREKLTLDQLKGIAGSVGSLLMTFIFSAILVSEIREAVLQHREQRFRPDLSDSVRTSFYNRYLSYRFFLLGVYVIAASIAIGEIFALCVGAALAPILLPSFIAGIALFTICQVIEIVRLNDEWRHERNWGNKAELENQIISTWIGLGLLLAGGVVGILGFSIVSTGLLVTSGIVLVLKIVNALTPKDPIQSVFEFFGISLFESNEYHTRQIYGPSKKRALTQNDFYFEMKEKYPANEQDDNEDSISDSDDEDYFESKYQKNRMNTKILTLNTDSAENQEPFDQDKDLSSCSL